MRPKDLVMDLFGDYIRYLGGSIRSVHLSRILELFEIEPSTTRMTLSRMRRDGWLDSKKEGREVVYSMTQQLLEVLDPGRERIFSPVRPLWGGEWTMVLYQIPETRRQERESLKQLLSWEGFGQLNTTTWVSPHEDRERMRSLLDDKGWEGIHVLTMTTGSLERDLTLAKQCWSLDDLASDYRKFVQTWQKFFDVAQPTIEPQEALRLRVRLVSEYRFFPFRDPNLPEVLRPKDWPGDEAFDCFIKVHRLLGPAANGYIADLVRNEVPSPLERTGR